VKEKSSVKIIFFVIALLISLGIWFFIIGVEQPEREDVISGLQVTLSGEEQIYEDRGLVVTSDELVTVRITVRGNLVKLAELNKRKNEIVVTADLSGVTVPGQQNLAYDIKLPVDGITISERSPFYIPVTVEKLNVTTVDVVVKNEGSVAEGFMASEPYATPSTLRLSGPQSVLDTIAYAEVVWKRENVTRTLTAEMSYSLYDADGNEVIDDSVTADVDVVTVTMEVKSVKNLRLEVDLIPGAGADESNVKCTIEPEFITVSGDAEILSTLNVLTIGEINLSEMLSTARMEFPIYLPNNVENISGETSCVVTVTIEGLATKTLKCEIIEVANVPEGYTAEAVTKSLSVVVRGEPAELELVSGYNLRVVADLSKASVTEGEYSVAAAVSIEGVSSVGVLGEYRIVVSIKDTR